MKEAKFKILFVSNTIPRPNRSSGELRTIRILEMLSKFWEIDFCIGMSPYSEWETREAILPYINNLSDIGIKVLPIKIDTFYKAIKNNYYAGGYFNFFWIAEKSLPIFKLTQPNAFTIVDSVDVHYARMEMQYNLGEISYENVLNTKKREVGVYKKGDVVVVVTKEDYHLLKVVNDIKNVFLIPNIVNSYPRIPGKRKPYVIFIGSYRWYPNPAAVKWFAQEIWPVVYQAVPEAEFLIIGSDPTKEVFALEEIPGVRVIGYVPDTKPYLDIAAVSIAPLRIGGGMKGKVNEAMAHGIPVVATTIGAQGFEAEHGKQMMIADDPSEFSLLVIALLQNPQLQSEIGLAGQELNSIICSSNSVKKTIEELVKHCSSLISKHTEHKIQPSFRLFFIKQQLILQLKIMKLKLLIYDVGHGIILLKREGIGSFLRRAWMYINGQRLETTTKSDKLITYSLSVPSQIIEFPELYEDPFVSIVISVYNQWNYTHACLDSIQKNSGNISYEIILADDNSTDETRFVEKYVKNIRVVRTETNLGFLFNCNNAAKSAKGKYIVLLNNDTLVQPDWLSWLIKPMEESGKIGLVGAKLIFPTGQLQEAGGIVFQDGSAMNYGKEDLPDQPQYNYFRDVDYCSGACICIKKEVWDRLNGFDPQYAPAYYEDTDLAMQIRSLGLRTVYQPKSIVIHFEGISNGTDIFRGIKKKQSENQIVFYRKWKEELYKNNYKSGENIFKARDKSKHKETVLLFDYSVPSDSVNSCKTLRMINYFTENGFNIKFLPDNFLRNEPIVSELEQKGIEILYGEYYKKNWIKWIKDNGDNINAVCFIDEVLSNKYSRTLKKILNVDYYIVLTNKENNSQIEIQQFHN